MSTVFVMLVAIAHVVATTPASAVCQGRSVRVSVAASGAREDTRTGTASTCDGLNDYFGRISDTQQDGYCAEAIYVDAGVNSTQGVDCSHDGVYRSYSFHDRNGDSQAWVFVCGLDCTGGWTWGF